MARLVRLPIPPISMERPIPERAGACGLAALGATHLPKLQIRRYQHELAAVDRVTLGYGHGMLSVPRVDRFADRRAG
jgi:hypothetical protein